MSLLAEAYRMEARREIRRRMGWWRYLIARMDPRDSWDIELEASARTVLRRQAAGQFFDKHYVGARVSVSGTEADHLRRHRYVRARRIPVRRIMGLLSKRIRDLEA